MVQIKATYNEAGGAREALSKLQALRAFEVKGLLDSGMLTATVDEAVADRALHLIRETGGHLETDGEYLE
ncbi:hypothetical protein ACFO9Q_17265 [Paenibacillus sp. GCM10023252]|uniref:hypothetical protein n=1 Tax=Paenibacillus sp. GCM10023252 TaxID=3252649 RepID=UPI00361FB129